MKGTKVDVEKSPVTRAKRQRTSESSGDDDWNYLLDSKYHGMCFDQIHHVLSFTPLSSESERKIECETSGIFLVIFISPKVV